MEIIGGHRVSLLSRCRILEHKWIDDDVLNAAQAALRLQFPNIKGLDLTWTYNLEKAGLCTRWDRICELRQKMLEQRPNRVTPRRVQAFYIPNHWVAVSNRHNENANIVYVMDSKGWPIHPDLPHLIAAAFRFREKEFIIRRRLCAEQKDGSSCGAFAMAFVTSDCYNRCTEEVQYDPQVSRA